MNQVSSKLRRTSGGYAHWCPGCEEAHILPDSWQFDGNIHRPSFSPSFKHEGVQSVVINGEWNGEWKRDSAGNTIPYICHYILTEGKLYYQNDCTHSLNNKIVELPDLPVALCDKQGE